MSKDQKTPEKIDHTGKNHADGVLERLERLDEEFDLEDARTHRRIDVLEDMLDIMNER